LLYLFILLLAQSQLTSVDQMRGTNISSLAAMEQTRMLANTLAQNDDPKFQVNMPYHDLMFHIKFCRIYLNIYDILWHAELKVSSVCIKDESW
jgi:hypothetical protein